MADYSFDSMEMSGFAKRKDIKRPYLISVVIFIVFTCLLPFGVGVSWVESTPDLLGGPNDLIFLRLFLWWLIRCVPSIVFIVLCYKNISHQIFAVLQALALLVLVSVAFIPIYWFLVLGFMFAMG